MNTVLSSAVISKSIFSANVTCASGHFHSTAKGALMEYHGFTLSEQQLHRVCERIAEMIASNNDSRDEIENRLTELTGEVFNCNGHDHEEVVAQLVIELLDGWHIKHNQGIMFDVIDTYVRKELFLKDTRAEYYNCVLMSALVNAIRIKNKKQFDVNTSFSEVMKKACDIIEKDGIGVFGEMSELLFSGKGNAILNISYNLPQVVWGVREAYRHAMVYQFSNKQVGDVVKSAFVYYLYSKFEISVALATTRVVAHGRDEKKVKYLFYSDIENVIKMLKYVLGR